MEALLWWSKLTEAQRHILEISKTKDILSIYLAGPWVFKWWTFEEKKWRWEEMKEICKKYSFMWLYPLDNEIEDFVPWDQNTGKKIFFGNKNLMKTADIWLFDLSNFRWQDVDSGTAFELWHMEAKEKLLYGYNTTYQTQIEKLWDVDENGRSVEDFGDPVNLMLSNAIRESWWKIIYAKNDSWAKEWDIFIQEFETSIKQIKEDIDMLKKTIEQ